MFTERAVRRCRSRMTSIALLGFLASTVIVSQARAETGTVEVVITKAGFVVGVGGGQGILTFRGKKYPFKVRGASLGATIGASTTKLVGKALHMKGFYDIVGTYSALSGGAALAGGAGGVVLQNAAGVVLQLGGPKLGVEFSASLAGVTITMD
jgi:lipid-binding SYLF domain-containing protein